MKEENLILKNMVEASFAGTFYEKFFANISKNKVDRLLSIVQQNRRGHTFAISSPTEAFDYYLNLDDS